MLAQPVELVLQHHVDVGLHQNLFGLEAESCAESLVVGLEQVEHVNPVVGTHDFLFQCGTRFHARKVKVFVAPFQGVADLGEVDRERFEVVVYLVVHVAHGFVAAVRTDELSLLEAVEQGRSIVRYMYVQFHKSNV